MNKAEREKLRHCGLNPMAVNRLLDYIDALEATRRFVIGCDCTVCKDNREALAKEK